MLSLLGSLGFRNPKVHVGVWGLNGISHTRAQPQSFRGEVKDVYVNPTLQSAAV